MRFAIFGYQSEDGFSAMKGADPALRQAYLVYIDALKSAGVFVFGARLESPATATTLRTNGDERVVQDGPYADTKEQLGGLLVIDVTTMDQAIEWASRMPPIPGRVYEIRPIPAYVG